MSFDPIFVLGVCGILICLYAIYVERNAKGKKRNYKPVCDINDNMSCTLVLTSEYAYMTKYVFNLNNDHPLNVPNTYYGLLFYSCIVLSAFIHVPFQYYLLLSVSSMSLLASGGLMYFMYKLWDFCLVCMASHVVNILLFISIYDNFLC